MCGADRTILPVRHDFCGGRGSKLSTESLILAQNERWRRGLGMQVERDFSFFEVEWRKGA